MNKMIFHSILGSVLVCAIVGLAAEASGEEPLGTVFERAIVHDSAIVGNSIRQLPDGGYIVAGYIQNVESGDEDALVIRTDSLGTELWRKTYGGSDQDNGWDIHLVADTGYILTGFTSSFGAGGLDAWLLRLDSRGDTLWTRTYGGKEDDLSWSVCVLKGGGFLLAAQTESFGSGERDTWTICTDASGDTVWTDITGGSEVDRIFSADQLTDGSVAVTGITNSEGHGDMDVLVMRYAVDGERLWRRTYGSPAKDIGHGICATRDGEILVAGYTTGAGEGDEDAMLLRLDRDGDSLWSSVFGRVLNDRGMIARELTGGGYVLAGFSRDTINGRWDGYLVRADPRGKVLWHRIIGDTHDETTYSVIQTADRGFALVGRKWSWGKPHEDLYLIKTDSLGRFRSQQDR